LMGQAAGDICPVNGLYANFPYAGHFPPRLQTYPGYP
jgi:hypothetical protein